MEGRGTMVRIYWVNEESVFIKKYEERDSIATKELPHVIVQNSKIS